MVYMVKLRKKTMVMKGNSNSKKTELTIDVDMGTPPVIKAQNDDMGTPPIKKAQNDCMGMPPIKC
jgi:hypothetical protein